MSRQEFPAKVREQAWDRCKGRCENPKCGIVIGKKKKHFDHILPDALKGKPILANCQVLCEPCHKEKTGKEDVPRIRKADRQRRNDTGTAKPSPNPMKSRGFDPRPEKPPKTGGKSDLSHLGPPEIGRRYEEKKP